MLQEIGLEPNSKVTFTIFKEIMKQDIKEEDLQRNASSLLSEMAKQSSHNDKN